MSFGFHAFDLQVIKGAKVFQPPAGCHSEPHSSPATGGAHTSITDLQYEKKYGQI